MQKRKKTGKSPKNALDTISETGASPQRETPPRTSPVTFAEVSERIEFEPVTESPLFEMAEFEQSKKGRHTVEDNFLLGSRNNWLRMFEENWADIGFALTSIRQNERGTIEDIRNAFKPLTAADTARFSGVFVQGLPEQVTGPELRRNRIAISELHEAIRVMHSHREVLLNSCAQADEALKQAVETERGIIQQQVRERKSNCSVVKTASAKWRVNYTNSIARCVTRKRTFIVPSCSIFCAVSDETQLNLSALRTR